MNRPISVLMLLILLFSLLLFNLNIRTAKSLETIEIRRDGSIEPPTAPIHSVDNVTYVVTANITDTYGIMVKRSNIVFDGTDHTIRGVPSGYGIYVMDDTNVTIKSMNIQGSSEGIGLHRCSECNITGNAIADNDYGIKLQFSKHNRVSGNDLAGNGYTVLVDRSSNNTISNNNILGNLKHTQGILILESSDNSILGNNISSGDDGLSVVSAPGNTFRNNNLTGNRYNLNFQGQRLQDFINSVDTSNRVDGKPVYYWINQRDKTIPNDAGYVALIDCRRIRVENLELTKNLQGLLLAYTSESLITGNELSHNDYGIWLHECFNNSIRSNTLTNNDFYGINLNCSDCTTVCQNSISNSSIGICISLSNRTRIFGNNITDSTSCAIYLVDSADNRVYHNNFMGNKFQVQCAFTVYIPQNVWDRGYPFGGNCWSSYSGIDGNGDGIGDTPYSIGFFYSDRYPLMTPLGPKMPKGPGDLNSDGKVGIADVVLAAIAYDSETGDYNWNLYADLAFPYGTINVLDVVTLVTNYGKTYS